MVAKNLPEKHSTRTSSPQHATVCMGNCALQGRCGISAWPVRPRFLGRTQAQDRSCVEPGLAAVRTGDTARAFDVVRDDDRHDPMKRRCNEFQTHQE